jgi:PTH1 family peptidyl-tRNA hydrolase
LKLVVGLGNPGPEYAWSRHNAGWLILDSIVARASFGTPREKFQGAFWPPSRVEGESTAFLKPFTYMNLSGKSVRAAAEYYDVPPGNVLVIFDDVAIPFGSLRYRPSGSAGGQKGMASIIASLGTLDVPRLRVGMGGPPEVMDMREWVLGKIPKEQRDEWPSVEDAAWDAFSRWLGGAEEGFTVKIGGERG